MSTKLFTTFCHDDALVVTAMPSVGSLTSADVRHEADCLMARMHSLDLKKIVFDMSQADYFNSSMIELLIIVWRYVSPAHGTLAMCRVSGAGREVLRIVGLDTFWPLCDTLDEALAAAQQCWESPA